MTLAYSVTFEFENRAPETWRGIVDSNPATAARKALAAANKALSPRQWSSVVVLLDRSPAGLGEATKSIAARV